MAFSCTNFRRRAGWNAGTPRKFGSDESNLLQRLFPKLAELSRVEHHFVLLAPGENGEDMQLGNFGSDERRVLVSTPFTATEALSNRPVSGLMQPALAATFTAAPNRYRVGQRGVECVLFRPCRLQYFGKADFRERRSQSVRYQFAVWPRSVAHIAAGQKNLQAA
jgi:hypothetical protein